MSPQLLLLLLWASPWIERKATFIGMDIGKEKYKLQNYAWLSCTIDAFLKRSKVIF